MSPPPPSRIPRPFAHRHDPYRAISGDDRLVSAFSCPPRPSALRPPRPHPRPTMPTRPSVLFDSDSEYCDAPCTPPPQKRSALPGRRADPAFGPPPWRERQAAPTKSAERRVAFSADETGNAPARPIPSRRGYQLQLTAVRPEFSHEELEAVTAQSGIEVLAKQLRRANACQTMTELSNGRTRVATAKRVVGTSESVTADGRSDPGNDGDRNCVPDLGRNEELRPEIRLQKPANTEGIHRDASDAVGSRICGSRQSVACGSNTLGTVRTETFSRPMPLVDDYRFIPPAATTCSLWDNTPVGQSRVIDPRVLAPEAVVVQRTALQAMAKYFCESFCETDGRALRHGKHPSTFGAYFIGHDLRPPHDFPSRRETAADFGDQPRPRSLFIDRFDPGRFSRFFTDYRGQPTEDTSWSLEPTILMPDDVDIRVYRSGPEGTAVGDARFATCSSSSPYAFLAKALDAFFRLPHTLQSDTKCAEPPIAITCNKVDGRTTIDCIALVPASAVKITPIRPLRLVLTTLSSYLLSASRNSNSADGEKCVDMAPKIKPSPPEMGYLVIDKFRHVLLLLPSDPTASELPVVGVWVFGTMCPSDSRILAAVTQFSYSTGQMGREPPTEHAQPVRKSETLRPGCCLVACFPAPPSGKAAPHNRNASRPLGMIPHFFEARWTPLLESDLPCQLLYASAPVPCFVHTDGGVVTQSSLTKEDTAVVRQGDEVEDDAAEENHNSISLGETSVRLVPLPARCNLPLAAAAKQVWGLTLPETCAADNPKTEEDDKGGHESPQISENDRSTSPLDGQGTTLPEVVPAPDNPPGHAPPVPQETAPSPNFLQMPFQGFPHMTIPGFANNGMSAQANNTPAELMLVQQQFCLTLLQQQMETLRRQLMAVSSHGAAYAVTPTRQVRCLDVGTNTTFLQPSGNAFAPVHENDNAVGPLLRPETVERSANTSFVFLPPHLPAPTVRDATVSTDPMPPESAPIPPTASNVGESGTLGTLATKDLFSIGSIPRSAVVHIVPESTENGGKSEGLALPDANADMAEPPGKTGVAEVASSLTPPRGTYRPLYEASDLPTQTISVTSYLDSEPVLSNRLPDSHRRGRHSRQYSGLSLLPDVGRAGRRRHARTRHLRHRDTTYSASMASSAAAAQRRADEERRKAEVGEGGDPPTGEGGEVVWERPAGYGPAAASLRYRGADAVPETERTFFDEESFRNLVGDDLEEEVVVSATDPAKDSREEPQGEGLIPALWEQNNPDVAAEQMRHGKSRKEGNGGEAKDSKNSVVQGDAWQQERRDDNHDRTLSLIMQKYIGHLSAAGALHALGSSTPISAVDATDAALSGVFDSGALLQKCRQRECVGGAVWSAAGAGAAGAEDETGLTTMMEQMSFATKEYLVKFGLMARRN